MYDIEIQHEQKAWSIMNTGKSGYVLGVDGGGTYSRAVCADLDGHVLAIAKGKGTSPSHNHKAFENTQAVLSNVIAAAGIPRGDVVAVAAGLAGLDRPSDTDWADKNTQLDGLAGRRILVNDSHIALTGALVTDPGILSIAGTGTITTGLLEDGRYVTNYTFNHYSHAGAQYVGRNAVFELFISAPSEQDNRLIEIILGHFKVDDLGQLHSLIAQNLSAEGIDSKRVYGNLAPQITDEAQRGSPIARIVCDRIAREIVGAILLLAAGFESERVSIALTGGVVQSAYVHSKVKTLLTSWKRKQLDVVEPVLPPVAGAVVLALKDVGIQITPATIDNLKQCSVLYG